MKLGSPKLKAPATQPRRQLPTNDGGWHENEDAGQEPFMALMRTAAGITRKELQYELRWSDTYIDGILNGSKNDPIEQTRKFCRMLLQRKRMDLVAAVAVHVCGGDDFDGRILTPEQNEALEQIARIVEE